jgi:uncharacterized protein
VPIVAEEEHDQHLVDDVLEGDGYVGILQPQDEDAEGVQPLLFSVGCLGSMEAGRPDNENEYLVGGHIRFRVVEELPPVRGYRRARVDYGEFEEDPLVIEQGLEFATLRDLARRQVEPVHPDFDFSILECMAGTEVATALAHNCALSPAERQALMEAPSLREVQDILLVLMGGPGQAPTFDLPPLPVC